MHVQIDSPLGLQLGAGQHAYLSWWDPGRGTSDGVPEQLASPAPLGGPVTEVLLAAVPRV